VSEANETVIKPFYGSGMNVANSANNRKKITEFAVKSPYFLKKSLVTKRVRETNETATKPF
jgi:hypothetical protein